MTTTKLIELLRQYEFGGATRRPREISFTVGNKFISVPDISVDGTGDGLFTEICLSLHGDDYPIGPVPDPDTGLMPCGCGGKATIKRGDAAYSGYFAMCSGCECAVGFDRKEDNRAFGEFPDEEQTKTTWNTAMGYKP